MIEKTNAESTSNLEEVAALKELVAVIVDYYCFKNDELINEDEDDDNYTYSKNDLDDNSIIPEDIDKLIQESFKSQLKKFMK